MVGHVASSQTINRGFYPLPYHRRGGKRVSSFVGCFSISIKEACEWSVLLSIDSFLRKLLVLEVLLLLLFLKCVTKRKAGIRGTLKIVNIPNSV